MFEAILLEGVGCTKKNLQRQLRENVGKRQHFALTNRGDIIQGL